MSSDRPDSDPAKLRAKGDIIEAKNVIENASVETVETPDSRKDVEIAWIVGDEFYTQRGTAVGVYHEPHRGNAETIHIDWADDRDRTSVETDSIVTFTESEYYTEE